MLAFFFVKTYRQRKNSHATLVPLLDRRPFWQVIDNSTTAVQLSVPAARDFANTIHQIMQGEATPEALKRVKESMYSEQLVDLIAAAHEQFI